MSSPDPKPTVEALLAAIRDTADSFARGELVRDLADVGSHDVVLPHLVEFMLHDEEWSIRTKAAWSLACLKPPAGAGTFLNALASEKDCFARDQIILVLADLRPPEAVPMLLKIVRDTGGDPVARAFAAEALGKIGCTEVLLHLAELLRNDNEELVRQGAAIALGDFGSGEALPALREAAANDRDYDVREDAIEAMAVIERKVAER